MKITLIYLLFSCLLLTSCDRILCGDLPKELEILQSRANSRFSDYLLVENIPCEGFYIKVMYKIEKIDTSIVHSVHKVLYDKKNSVGWPVLLVHDKSGEYIFSHNYENKIYIQTGD